MSEMNLSIRVRAADQLSGPIQRMMQNVERASQRAERSVVGLGTSVDRLGRSGARLDGLLNRLRQIGREALNVRENFARMERGMNGLSRYGAAAAATGYVISKPINNSLEYDKTVSNLANTVYSNRDVQGRVAGKAELQDIIAESVKASGLHKSMVAQTLGTLVASGVADPGTIKTLLPMITKKAVAADADPNKLAGIAIAALQNTNIKSDKIGAALDAALFSGQRGGFEIKDMAEFLPGQLAGAANQIGMRGFNDYLQILALNQAARTTAGSPSEAGNNVINLLQKINSQDTATDFKKLGYDLSGSLARARAKGVSPLDAFTGFVDKIAMQDRRYAELQKKLKGAKTGDEQQQALQAMADILMGGAIGKVIQDRQALLAYLGYSNKGYVQPLLNDLRAGKYQGAGDSSYAVLESSPGYKVERAKNVQDLLEAKAFDKLNPAIGSLADKAVELAQKHEKLAQAAIAATEALMALAAGGALLALAGGLKGKFPLPGGKLPIPGGKPTPPGPGSIWERLAPKPKAPPPSLLRTLGPRLGIAGAVAGASYGIGYGGAALYDHMTRKPAAAGPLPADWVKGTPLEITNHIILDGRQIAQSVNTINGQQARRN